MARTIAKGFGLVVMVVAVCGAYTGPCAPVWIEAFIEDVTPAAGPIAEDTVTMVVTTTEERTVAVCADIFISLDRWNEQQQWWQAEAAPSSWDFGEKTPTGECSSIRDIVVTFEDVPMVSGENRFRVQLYIDGCDGYEDETIYQEVVYTH